MIGVARPRTALRSTTIAYCPPELLDDLRDVLANLRTWAGVIEKRPGVFYVGRQPFLHFHLLVGSRRRADVKGQTTWTQIDLPRPVSAAKRRILVAALRMRYRETRAEKAVIGGRHRA